MDHGFLAGTEKPPVLPSAAKHRAFQLVFCLGASSSIFPERLLALFFAQNPSRRISEKLTRPLVCNNVANHASDFSKSQNSGV
jgi:hypothetical protein